jgi:hypothetical protein
MKEQVQHVAVTLEEYGVLLAVDAAASELARAGSRLRTDTVYPALVDAGVIVTAEWTRYRLLSLIERGLLGGWLDWDHFAPRHAVNDYAPTVECDRELVVDSVPIFQLLHGRGVNLTYAAPAGMDLVAAYRLADRMYRRMVAGNRVQCLGMSRAGIETPQLGLKRALRCLRTRRARDTYNQQHGRELWKPQSLMFRRAVGWRRELMKVSTALRKAKRWQTEWADVRTAEWQTPLNLSVEADPFRLLKEFEKLYDVACERGSRVR